MGLLDQLFAGSQPDPMQLQMLQLLGVNDPAQLEAMQKKSRQQALMNAGLQLATTPGEMSYYPNRGANIAKAIAMAIGGIQGGGQQATQQQIAQLMQMQQLKEMFGKQQREAAMRAEYQKIIDNPANFADLKPGQRAALDIASKTGNMELLTKIITDAYNPEKQQQPNEWATYLNAAGGDPNKALALRRADEIARAQAGGVKITNMPPDLKGLAEALGGGTGKMITDLSSQAQTAAQVAQGIGNYNDQLKGLPPMNESVAGIAQALRPVPVVGQMIEGHYDRPNESGGQVMDRIGAASRIKSKLALDAASLLKGQVSNYEDQLVLSSVPSITQTEQGRAILQKIAEARRDQSLEAANLANELAGQGKSPSQIQIEVNKVLTRSITKPYWDQLGFKPQGQQQQGPQQRFKYNPATGQIE